MSTEKPIPDFIQDADIEVDKGRSEATFRYTIRNFSNVAKNKTRIYSPNCFVKNIPCSVMSMNSNNDFGLFLYCDLPIDDTSWRCAFRDMHFRIVPARSNLVPLIRKSDNREVVLNSQEYSRGNKKIETVDFLLSPESGYIKDDAITLEMYIYVSEAVGASRTDGKKDDESSEAPNDLIRAITLQDVDKCSTLLEDTEYHNVEDINGRTPLMWAAYKGNLKIVQLLVEANCNIDAADVFGYSPLIRAVEFGHVEVVEYLLKRGANINFSSQVCLRCDLRFTAVHFAAHHLKDSENLVKLLIGKGADLSSVQKTTAIKLTQKGARSQVDSSTLIWSIKSKEFDLTKMLLQTEEHVNGTDADGCSPLTHAVRSENLEILEILLQKGANPNKRQRTGGSPFLESIKGKNLKIIECLSKYGNPFMFHSALHSAILTQDISVIEIVLQNGGNVNAIGEDGDTPLTKSVTLADYKLSEFLIERGADVNLKDGNGFTAILQAVDLNILEFIKYLLSKGSNVNIFYPNGSTPLLQCIQKGTLEVLQLLVENGADVNASDKNGTTPLLDCLSREKHVFFKFLIDRGADLGFSDDVKERILSVTLKTKNFMSLVHLIDQGVDFSSCQKLLETLAREDFYFAMYLKEKGPATSPECANEEAVP